MSKIDTRRMLAKWLGKTAERLKIPTLPLLRGLLPTPERNPAFFNADTALRTLFEEQKMTSALQDAFVPEPGKKTGGAPSAITGLALKQICGAQQALINDFGLPFGLAAPEVVVLDLYPIGYEASLEILFWGYPELMYLNSDSNVNPTAFADFLIRHSEFASLFNAMTIERCRIQHFLGMPPLQDSGDSPALLSSAEA
ncbi:MAG: hypothetical protein LBR95_03585, partial [Azoarcus sp.]|nr:hypothetical protein [Azoarcus sp.]